MIIDKYNFTDLKEWIKNKNNKKQLEKVIRRSSESHPKWMTQKFFLVIRKSSESHPKVIRNRKKNASISALTVNAFFLASNHDGDMKKNAVK